MSDADRPAFPVVARHAVYCTGMTLRDWFAGMAMQGMLASPALLEVVTSAQLGAGTHHERMARRAYEIADKMLAEKSKGGEQND